MTLRDSALGHYVPCPPGQNIPRRDLKPAVPPDFDRMEQEQRMRVTLRRRGWSWKQVDEMSRDELVAATA